jgi:hypothetical protein
MLSRMDTPERCGKTGNTREVPSTSSIPVMQWVPEYHRGCGGGTNVILVPGQRYTTEELTLVGWTTGDGSGHEGYSCWSYFGADGRYLGPDGHGIEPIFEREEDETCHHTHSPSHPSGT